MFFPFGIKDVIDIVLVALMLYYSYRLMKESRSLNVFIGIMVGILFGSLPISIPNMPVAMKLGLAGGPLIIAILLGCFCPQRYD